MTEGAPTVAELLNLGGRVALVTGASGGVGAAMLNDWCRATRPPAAPVFGNAPEESDLTIWSAPLGTVTRTQTR